MNKLIRRVGHKPIDYLIDICIYQEKEAHGEHYTPEEGADGVRGTESKSRVELINDLNSQARFLSLGYTFEDK